ncbi:MAG TPA: SufE family protein [Saprospiraceae bacterium]|nr:SufE family protein [Saprospiraceae bacterium]HQW57279.1 SufE family protein [Saprospiraceae bacterium]
MTIEDKQQEIIQHFSFFTEWMDKYEEIIRMGRELPPLDTSHHTDEKLIKGCQSKVWLNAEMKDGKLIFEADSDAIITKGLVAMMVSVLSDHTPEDIIKSELYFIEEIGLTHHLSPTRSNGLLAMVKQMKNYAIAFQTLSKIGKI